MPRLDSIFRSMKFAHLAKSEFTPALTISKMLGDSDILRSQFSALDTRNTMLKSIGIYKSDWMQNLSLGMQLNSSLARVMETMMPKYSIPRNIFSTLDSINHNYNRLFQSLKVVSDVSPHFQAVAQMNNLKFALSGLKGQMASIAAAQRQWDLFEHFNKITEQVAELAEPLDNPLDWKEEAEEGWSGIIQYIQNLYAKNRKFARLVYIFLLTVLPGIMTYHQYFLDIFFEKPEPVSKEDFLKYKEDFQKFKEEIVRQIEEKLVDKKEEYRRTTRDCKVRLKPNPRSFVITTLPDSCDVIVIQTHHKWVYVSFSAPDDNLPQTGWVLKKYLAPGK